MERTSSQSQKAISLITAVFISYIITFTLLFLLAFLMLQTGISGGAVSAGVIIISIVSVFAGSFFLGKKIDQKRFLWGLVTAVIYFAVYIVISLVIKSDEAVVISDYIKTFFVLAASGMLGGMLS